VYHGDYLVGNTTTPFSGMSREFTIYRHVWNKLWFSNQYSSCSWYTLC
jgi:hypothetical protein